MTTAQWRTLMDWDPAMAVALNDRVLAESPTALSPPLTSADDDAILLVDCHIARGTSGGGGGDDELIWTAFPAIRAGDYRMAANATGTRVDNLASPAWGEVGVISNEGQGRRLVFGKGQNGRPAIAMVGATEGLHRLRVRLYLSLAAAPGVSAPPASTPAATAASAAVRAPATLGGRTYQELPVTTAPNQRIQTLIGGVATTIALRWDSLSGAWYLGLEQGGRNLIAGRRIVPGLRLLPMNLGWQLVAAPLSDALGSVGRNAWGDTHLLLFVPTPDQVSWLR